MIGRTMMGRVDSRLRQAKATDDTLGGIGCVCVGDPAQCEAMFDKQLYDETPARDDVDGNEKKNTRLSNMGLAVYDEFDEAIVLTTVHRMGQIEDPQTPEDHAYNARAHTFWDIMLRLRDALRPSSTSGTTSAARRLRKSHGQRYRG